MSQQNIGSTRDVSGAAPALALRMRAFVTYFSEDFLGGPRVLKMAWVINFQKGGTFLFYALLLLFIATRLPPPGSMSRCTEPMASSGCSRPMPFPTPTGKGK